MPTGYTDCIGEGATFKEFAMRAARGMGACISMKDDSLSDPIPDEFEPSTYYKDQVEDTKTALAEIESLSEHQAQDRADEIYEREVQAQKEKLGKNARVIGRYRAMLKLVDAWEPPTLEHVKFKEFMQEQICSSIRSDDMTEYYRNEVVEKQTGADWLTAEIASLREALTRYKKEWAKEQERTSGRSEWVRQLRISLGLQTTKGAPE